MDVLGALPVWAQLLIAFLVGGILILLNFGWLMQAKGWLDRQKQRQGGTAQPSGEKPAAPAPRDRM